MLLQIARVVGLNPTHCRSADYPFVTYYKAESKRIREPPNFYVALMEWRLWFLSGKDKSPLSTVILTERTQKLFIRPSGSALVSSTLWFHSDISFKSIQSLRFCSPTLISLNINKKKQLIKHFFTNCCVSVVLSLETIYQPFYPLLYNPERKRFSLKL